MENSNDKLEKNLTIVFSTIGMVAIIVNLYLRALLRKISLMPRKI